MQAHSRRRFWLLVPPRSVVVKSSVRFNLALVDFVFELIELSVRLQAQSELVHLADVRVQAAAWRRDYNANHPHSSLGNLAPEEFARRAKNITQNAVFSGVPAE